MAITLTQDLPFLPYPAFNNSYIRFTSTINPSRAEIEVFPKTKFPNNFVIYADTFGRFLFDLTEISKAAFSVQEFEHQGVSSFVWGQSFLGNLVTVNCTIRTFNSSTSDSLSKSYQFYKGVRQVGEEIFNQYLLTPQTDPLTYELTYWEGFPFDFQIQSVGVNDDITVRNLNTGATSNAMTAVLTGGFAVHIDRVSDNWTTSTFLPLNDFVNRLEVYDEGIFKCNLNLTKKEPCKGVYLRFFNNQGGINYHLFDEFYRDTLTTSTINEIATNSFTNVGSLVNPITSTGREGSKKLRLKTTVSQSELKVLRHLYTSPKIELYTSNEPFIQGEWITVKLDDGSLPIETKKDKTEVTLSIELPQINTLSL